MSKYSEMQKRKKAKAQSELDLEELSYWRHRVCASLKPGKRYDEVQEFYIRLYHILSHQDAIEECFKYSDEEYARRCKALEKWTWMKLKLQMVARAHTKGRVSNETLYAAIASMCSWDGVSV